MGIKVVINADYGGFGLSELAKSRYKELAGKTEWTGELAAQYSIERHDPALVRAVEELGDEANSKFAKLKVIEIESDRYRIEEYDGYETIETPETIEWVFVGWKTSNV